MIEQDKDKKIVKSIFLVPLFSSFVMGALAIAIVIYFFEILSSDVIRDKKQMLISYHKQVAKDMVESLKDDILNIINQTDKQIKDNLKQRIDEAAVIIDKIIKENPKDSINEIKRKVALVLSAIRYDHGNGYYFAYDKTTQISLVHPLKKFIGKNMGRFRDKRGTLLNRLFEQVVNNKQSSGYATIYFAKPNDPNHEYKKIVYVRYIKKLNWIIGTGKYEIDMKKEIEKKILKRVDTKRYGKNGYFWINDIKGVLLAHPYLKSRVGTNVLDIKDINGVSMMKLFIINAKKNYPKGAYLEYYWHKPNSKKIIKKLSYVILIKKLHWIIGTGVYLDDVKKSVQQSSIIMEKTLSELLLSMLIFFIASFVIVLILSLYLSKNSKELFNLYKNDLEDRVKKATIELKEKNRSLEESLQSFDALFESAMEAMVISKDTKIVEVNRQCLNILNYKKKEDAIGHSILEFVPNDFKEIVNEKLSQEAIGIYEAKILTKDGKTKQILAKGKNLHIKGDIYRLTTFIDITDMKTKEKLLQQQSKLAAMGEMIGAIAHQWRQPLNALAIRIQNLEDDYEDGLIDKKFLKKFIKENMNIIKFMSKTIEDFRNFFAPSKEKQEFDVKMAIQKVVDIQKAQLNNHDITLEIEGENFIINGYESEFKQVILNIINNAKDAIIDDKIKDGKITIELNKQTKSIKIKDNANGIPKELRDRIFEPYFTTKEEGKGTGIGLYMSKIIIEKNLGGTLELLDSDKGAVFEIKVCSE